MSNENTKGIFEFIISHVLWALISWISYKEILFRCLGLHTQKESRMIFLGILLASCVLGMIFQMKNRRNGFSVFANLSTGYGIYCLICYYSIKKKLCLIILILAAGFALANALLLICRKIKRKRRWKKIILRRTLAAFRGSWAIMSIALLSIMLVIAGNALFGGTIVKSNIPTATRENVEEQTIANNIETLVKLKQETWETLSVEKKISVLQVVANIEQRYLGLPNELKVVSVNLREKVAGSYSDNGHEIRLDLNQLEQNTSRELVDTVLHESYHSLQHRMVDAYNEANDNLKNLIFYYDAAKYKEEFSHYDNGEKDIRKYYYQSVEVDARRYAQKAVDEYFQRVDAYLKEKEQAGNQSEDARESAVIKTKKYPFVEDNSWTLEEVNRYYDEHGLIGYMDRSGKEITQPIFLEASQMSNGIAMVREKPDWIYYIDSEGKRVTKDYLDGYDFDASGKLARVKTEDGKWAIINRDDEIIYSGADKISYISGYMDTGTAVCDGHAVIFELDFDEQDDKISCKNMLALEEMQDISDMSMDIFAIVTDRSGKKGVINRYGKTLIAPKYESIEYDSMRGEVGNVRRVTFKLQKADGSYDFYYFDME